MYLDCVRRSSWSTTTLDTLTKVLEAAKKYGDDVVEILKEDLKSSLECMEKQDYKKEEIFNTSLTQSCQNMIVVKLKSGSILLYAPVRMHKENPELILSWIESLGWVFTWGRTTNDVLIFEISRLARPDFEQAWWLRYLWSPDPYNWKMGDFQPECGNLLYLLDIYRHSSFNAVFRAWGKPC